MESPLRTISRTLITSNKYYKDAKEVDNKNKKTRPQINKLIVTISKCSWMKFNHTPKVSFDIFPQYPWYKFPIQMKNIIFIEFLFQTLNRKKVPGILPGGSAEFSC